MAGTEPLNQDGSPPCCEARTVNLEMEDKMAQIKKLQLMNKIIGKETYYYNTSNWHQPLHQNITFLVQSGYHHYRTQGTFTHPRYLSCQKQKIVFITLLGQEKSSIENYFSKLLSYFANGLGLNWSALAAALFFRGVNLLRLP